MNGRNLKRNHASSRRGEGSQRPQPDLRVSPGSRPTTNTPPFIQDPMSQDEIYRQMKRTQKETHAHSEGDSDSSLPSPIGEQYPTSDLDASGEESDHRPPPSKTAVWIVTRRGQKVMVYLFCCGGKFECETCDGQKRILSSGEAFL